LDTISKNWVWFWKLIIILKIGYDFENWVWFWKQGIILKLGCIFENWVWFWKLGMIWKLIMILKIGNDFENWEWFWKLGMIWKMSKSSKNCQKNFKHFVKPGKINKKEITIFFENWLYDFGKYGMIFKIAYDFEKFYNF
jgi:hypothetical protein